VEVDGVRFRYPAADQVSLASLEPAGLPATERPSDAWVLRDVTFQAPVRAAVGAVLDGLIYRFRLRPLTANSRQDLVPFAADGHEIVIDCVFSAPGSGDGANGPEQEGTCWLPDGQMISARVNDERGGQADGVRAFAGSRWDPFFEDFPAEQKTIAMGKLAFADIGANFMEGKNVLSVVAEFDCARLLAGAELFAVVGETLTRGNVNLRIERTGRPVHDLLLDPRQFDQVNRDLEIRDLYNMDDAFRLSTAYVNAYRARLNANLAFWDRLDGKTDWPGGADSAHPLTKLILADYLVVDVATPYAERGSFLEIELAARRGQAHRTCGGRAPNDDVMDTLFTLMVNGGNGPVIRDGVDQPTVLASREFPYLAAPNPDPPEAPACLARS
jgi:Domain of unknown function (DUF4331)